MSAIAKILSSFVIVAATSTTVTAQLPPSNDRAAVDAARADVELRAKLAEEVIAARETPGREFAPRYRAMLLDKLKTLSADELQKRLDTRMILTPDALGDSSADLTYTPLSAPCRIIDTRTGGGALTGGAPGPSRSFIVAGSASLAAQGGSATGCGVPVGATAVLINFVAVNPQGLGNLRGAAFPNSVPTTGSVVNYQALNPVLNIANGLLFPICDPSVSTCTSDITLLANGAATDLVADVLGYAMKFPKTQVQSFTTMHSVQPGVSFTSTCVTGSSYTVNAPVPGVFHVRAKTIVFRAHTAGDVAAIYATVSLNPANCTAPAPLNREDAYDPSHPTGTFYVTLQPEGLFQAVNAGPMTLYLNAILSPATTDTATVGYVGWVVTFEPN